MAILSGYTGSGDGNSHDVLDGFEPGVYDVTLVVASGGLYLGGADIDPLTSKVFNWAASEGPFRATTSPGELFVQATSGTGYRVIAVPRVD